MLGETNSLHEMNAQLKRRSVEYLWSTVGPLNPFAGCNFSFRKQLDGENSLEHMADPYKHNTEGNACQAFVHRCSSLGMKLCTLHNKAVTQMTLLGCPWHSGPSISVEITESTDNSSSVPLFCAVCTHWPLEDSLLVVFLVWQRLPS